PCVNVPTDTLLQSVNNPGPAHPAPIPRTMTAASRTMRPSIMSRPPLARERERERKRRPTGRSRSRSRSRSAHAHAHAHEKKGPDRSGPFLMHACVFGLAGLFELRVDHVALVARRRLLRLGATPALATATATVGATLRA